MVTWILTASLDKKIFNEIVEMTPQKLAKLVKLDRYY